MVMIYVNGVALDANDDRVQRLAAEEQAQYVDVPVWKYRTPIQFSGTQLPSEGVGGITSNDNSSYVGTEGCRRVYPKDIY